jgi:hypothetical protein
MRATARLALLLGFAGWVSTAQAQDELDRLARNAKPDTLYRGMHSDFSDDEPIGRFMDLLAEGAIKEARSLQPQVCAAWTRGRDTSPLSGRFSVNGVELSLNRLCGLDEPTPRR